MRARGGKVRLRIEDLDAGRVVPELCAAAERDLAWLGLDWDGPSWLQSDGLERIEALVRGLVDQGLAYACSCSRGDVRSAQSAPQLGVSEPRYPGTCRDRYPSIEVARRESGRPVGVRLRVAPGSVAFQDDFAGQQAFDVAQTVGDFLIARRDGAPAYQLAVVADDAEQRVTEVVRGDDLLPSTARQILLQRALGLPSPRWAHVPLVLDAQGQRLAKRAGALSLAELRAQGVDPRTIVSWVARSAGLTAHEPLTAREALSAFDWTRLPHAPTRFEPEDLQTNQQPDG